MVVVVGVVVVAVAVARLNSDDLFMDRLLCLLITPLPLIPPPSPPPPFFLSYT